MKLLPDHLWHLIWVQNFFLTHSWQDNGKKRPFFHGFLTFCSHIYVPNGANWGSTSCPHIGDMMMNLFSLWGRLFMTRDGLKMVNFGPKRAGLSTLQKGPKGSERDQNCQPKCCWPFGTHFGPIWTPLDHFRQECFFCPKWTGVGVDRGASEQNINSCLKLSKRVHMDPKGFLMVKNKWPFFCHYLAMNGKVWVQKKFSTHI